MSAREAVLFANEAFYRAFADRDLRAMSEIWSERVPVLCIHPGWPPVQGREAVLKSWQGILGNPDSPAISCLAAEAYINGEMAFVVCYEEIQGQYLIATNVFVREGGPWRLVHHHAGPTSGAPPEQGDEGEVRTRMN